MRRIQRQEIIELIATLQDANEEIKNNIKNGNYAGAQVMLVQCQECAISIGNVIENVESKGFVTVHYIEEYCDALYHAYAEIDETVGANASKIFKNLKKYLLRVENSVRNDIPIRKEIVFFPYKASMWDSLESVYLKAKEDATCDAYCVPIPYYDINPDGSLGQMHYEGGEYPKNIEIIDWEKYDFENIKPDVAYIHNPYDDCNLVTRVHSRFYSSNLKKYVGELIYIPYFILKEIEPNDQSAIDGMKHFIWTPGVVNADRVIVQSEKMAQIYRSEFRKAAIANGLPEKYTSKTALEKKILGLGSPKIEKVKSTKKEDLEIPQEWQKIINKPDGSHKKIVFYNTSVGALLENNEKMLEKMKDVFRIFKENKDEIALLWRPHPLIETTVKAMRPQLWGEYKKIVEQYKAEGWGIYDDTADMDRAVVLSDAYYGDGSSIVQLYQQTGKPTLLQNCSMLGNAISEFVPFEGGAFANGKIWFIHRVFKCLCSIDMNTFEMEYEADLFSDMKERSYRRNIVCKDKMYFLPGKDESILEYDLITGKIDKYQYGEGNDIVAKFYSSVLYEDCIYLFPVREKFILQFNIKTKQYNKIVLPVENEKAWEANGYFAKRNVKVGSKVYVPCVYTNKLLIVDLESQVLSWKNIDICNTGFRDITLFKNKILLLDSDMNVYEMSLSTETEIEKKCTLSNEYEFMIVCGEQIGLIPRHTSKISMLDMIDKTETLIDYPQGHRFQETITLKGFVTYSDICETDDEVYLLPRFSNRLVIINKNTREVSFHLWKVGRSLIGLRSSDAKKKIKSKETLSEEGLDLKYFLSMIIDDMEE